MLNGKTREIVQDILSTAQPEQPTPPPVINFSGISGNGHTFNVHIITGAATSCWQRDTDRDRRLVGIEARLRDTPGGTRKLAAYLRRKYGVDRAEQLDDADVEKLYSWVHSLPKGP